jgi:dipeptidyl aminopeptidase/acylaminoacyl peptidase
LRTQTILIRQLSIIVVGLSLSTAAGALGTTDDAVVPAAAGSRLDVRMVVEAPEFVDFSSGSHVGSLSDRLVLKSPDRRRYVFFVRARDAASNSVRIVVYTGLLTQFGPSMLPRKAATIETDGLGFAPTSAFNSVEWIGENAIALRWQHRVSGPAGILKIDLEDGAVTEITESVDVSKFAFGADGNTVIYTVSVANGVTPLSREQMQRGSFVTTSSVESVLNRDPTGRKAASYGAEVTYVRDIALSRTVRVHGADWDAADSSYGPLSISPDGRHAIAFRAHPIISEYEHQGPHSWDAYRGAVQRHRANASDLRGFSYQQPFVIDMTDGSARRLPGWENVPFRGSGPVTILWAPDGRSFILGPTYEPLPGAGDAGLMGGAVVEVDLASGRFSRLELPIPESEYSRPTPVARRPDGSVEIQLDQETVFLKKEGSTWQRVQNPSPVASPADAQRFELEVRQNINQPPQLFARGPDQREQLIFDPTRNWEGRQSLACVVPAQWTMDDRRPVSGLIYLPPGFDLGRRYPLVIQTYGYRPDEFALTGRNQMTTAFAAQVIANRGIIVLQIEHITPTEPGVMATPREPQLRTAQAESAVQYLGGMGLVDPARVGITGFSRTGWHVAYALTHSSFRFAAAIAADNFDGGYFQSVLSGNFTGEPASDNGGPGFGEGLQSWLVHAPGFNADKVHTPLLLQNTSQGILNSWEMFSRLRALHRPVELLTFEDGGHALENPAQLLMSQGAAVDWYDFWLNGHEDPSPEKADQYRRWREMRRTAEPQRNRAPAAAAEGVVSTADLRAFRNNISESCGPRHR